MDVEVLGGGLEIEEGWIEEPDEEVRRQIDEYERGERRSFDLAVRFPDTFTGRVMRAMDEIPYGETRTYGDLADAVRGWMSARRSACNPTVNMIGEIY